MIGFIQVNTVIQRWACVKHACYPWSGLVSPAQRLQYSQAMLNSTCLSSACSHQGGHRAVRCWHPFHPQHQQHCGLGYSFAVSLCGKSFLKQATVLATDVDHVYKSVEVCDTKSILTLIIKLCSSAAPDLYQFISLSAYISNL